MVDDCLRLQQFPPASQVRARQALMIVFEVDEERIVDASDVVEQLSTQECPS